MSDSSERMTETTAATDRTIPLDRIQVGMRLRSTVNPAGNQAIVTAITDRGFQYRIPDDEEIVHPHWSVAVQRDGHEAFAMDGRLFWEPVLQ